jgi:hypothetical protein
LRLAGIVLDEVHASPHVPFTLIGKFVRRAIGARCAIVREKWKCTKLCSASKAGIAL